MNPEYIFFDLDGTLTDSYSGIRNSLLYALKALSLPGPPKEKLRSIIGPPLQDIFADILETDDPRRIDKAVALYRQYYKAKGIFENRVYNGVFPLLQHLLSDGRTLAVVTSKPWVFADKIVDHFRMRSFFTSVYGPELDGTRKNKIDLLRYALDAMGVKPDGNAVMVGDRWHDIRAAHENRLTGIGVLWGYGGRTELEQAGADRLCASPAQLSDALMGGNGTR